MIKNCLDHLDDGDSKEVLPGGSPRPSHNTLFLFVLASQNEHNHDQLTIYMLGFF